MKHYLPKLIKLKTIILLFVLLQSCFTDGYNNTKLDVLDIDVIQIMRNAKKIDSIKIDTIEIDTIKYQNP